MNRVKLPSVLLAVLLILLAAGCQSDELGNRLIPQEEPPTDENASDDGQRTVLLGVCFDDEESDFAGELRHALTQEAQRDQRVTLQFLSWQEAGEVDPIDRFLLDGVDAMMVCAPTDEQVLSTLERAKTAGIPVVFFDREPDLDLLAATYDKARFVGIQQEDPAIQQGKMAVSTWFEDPEVDCNGDVSLSYLLLLGEHSDPDTPVYLQYIQETLEAGDLDLDCLGQYYCDGERDKAREAVALQLAKDDGDIEMILAHSDNMALGALEALQEAGMNDGEGRYVPVYGMGGDQEVLGLIKEERLSGTVYRDIPGTAAAMLILSINAANGLDFLGSTNYHYDLTGIAVRIPYVTYPESA